MSYIYARGYGRSLNDDSYEVRIINTASGSDTNKQFALDPNGFTLTYESENDQLLLPGIVHSRCDVITLWPSNEFATLETLLTALGASQDGDYLLEIIQDSATLWVGTILVEEVSVEENSAQRAVKFGASDGISMLRNEDYNNNGSAYQGYQTIKGILENIQEKWVVWDYMNAQHSGTTARFHIVDDVYSEDDYQMALLPHPAGSQYETFTRSRIHTNPWSKQNDAGDTQYINAYDLLQSLCLTYQMRLYSYGTAWYMLPCALADENPTGYTFDYGGTTQTTNPIQQWSYQISGSDTRQKGSEWVRTFTPQTKQMSLTRDPNDGATILSALNVANNAVLTGADVQYDGVDTEDDETRYLIFGRLEVANSAITIDENDDLGRFVLRFEIKWAPDGVAEYYKNVLGTMYDGQIAVSQMLDGINVNYAPFFTTSQGYSATAQYFSVLPDSNNFYTPSVAGSRIVEFSFAIPPPQTAKVGLQLTPSVQAYNPTGQESATLQNALTLNFESLAVKKYSSEGPENLESFDFVARSTAGQNKQHLGTTFVGALGKSMGRIEVQTSAGVYGTSDNWVSQASSDARPINELCVEEVLAGHTRARGVERGSIVFRGTATPPKPFSRFYDSDTGSYYTALNWTLQATPCEVDVTLRQVGRNPISITTDYANTLRSTEVPPTDVLQGPVKPEPQIMYGYNNQARTNFAGDWSAVIGGTETKEMYFTVANDGQGRYIDDQGNTPAVGYVIKRKTYVNTKGLQERTDSGWTAPAALQPADNDDLAACIVLMQNYMNKVGDHGSYTFMVTYDEVSTNALLDDYSGATAAYGLRKLRNAYGGNAIQVRKADLSSQTIGFTAQGDLDTTALETFANGGDLWVSSWYDQTGNNRHCIQSATASQPKICESGTTITLNGKPAIKFDGSNDSLATASAFNANVNVNELIVAWVGSVTNLTAGNNMVSHWNSSTANQVFQVQMTASNDNLRWQHRYSNGSLATADNGSAITSGDQYIVVGHTKQNKHEAYYEGVKATGTAQNAAPNDASTSFRIGSRSDNQAGPHQGMTQCVVVWSRATAADDPDDISDALNDYYSSY